MSIPTLILFKNGEAAPRVIGAYPKARSRRSSSPRSPEPA